MACGKAARAEADLSRLPGITKQDIARVFSLIGAGRRSSGRCPFVESEFRCRNAGGLIAQRPDPPRSLAILVLAK
jgi:hypothetical protein